MAHVPLGQAVHDGDRRAALEAIAAKLAAELAGADGRDAATLAKELRAVLAEVEELSGGKEASAVDDLTARRAARRAAGRADSADR